VSVRSSVEEGSPITVCELVTAHIPPWALSGAGVGAGPMDGQVTTHLALDGLSRHQVPRLHTVNRKRASLFALPVCSFENSDAMEGHRWTQAFHVLILLKHRPAKN
jgi:hypothetical protein